MATLALAENPNILNPTLNNTGTVEVRMRATDPKQFALFTGRDQMQALTGLFARQFGTPNYAAHGGFCSVNMAAGGLYSIGGAFWEFGEPDWDRSRLFLMFGAFILACGATHVLSIVLLWHPVVK